MKLTADSEGVRSYLPLIQGVIDRMAANSANCKTWCVTIVSALAVLAIDKEKPDAILIGLLPLAMFFFLDAYYLSLERDFRDTYNAFVKKLHQGSATTSDLYILKPQKSGLKHRTGAFISTIFSLSITPFYAVLVVAMLIARQAVAR